MTIIKKRKEKKHLFYLIAIAIMVAIMGISCSSPAKPLANFSDEAVETPVTTPPTEEGENQITPTQPSMSVNPYIGPIQFVGKSFKNAKYTATIGSRGVNGQAHGSQIIVVMNDGATTKNYILSGSSMTFSQGEAKYVIYSEEDGSKALGNAIFREPGNLLIHYNNNQSDLINLKLVN